MNNQIASFLGGGAGFANGAWRGPTYEVSSISADGSVSSGRYNNVGDALGGLNQSLGNVNDRVGKVEDVVNGGNIDSGDSLKWNNDLNAYDASHGTGSPQNITNVANGKVEAGSTDAVNGGQLWDTNQRIDNIETGIQGVVDNAVMYDKDENGKRTNTMTLQGGDRDKGVTINNVADGRIEEGSKEAINGGQLYSYAKTQMNTVLDESKTYADQRMDEAVASSNRYTDMRFNQLANGVEEAKKEARQAAAIGLAASNLRYFDEPGSIGVAFGSGYWKGESAVAMGAGYTSESGKFRSNLSVTTTGNGFGMGAGLSIKTIKFF